MKHNYVFKFEKGKIFKRLRLVILPVKIGLKPVKHFSNIVGCELPLLLSKYEIQTSKVKKERLITMDKP